MKESSIPVKIAIHPDVITQEIEDELVLLHMGSEDYFSLDDVGTAMWKLLVAHGDLEQVIAILLDEYDVEEARVRDDLHKLVLQLLERKLVIPAEY
jgi:hypothetical protein